MNPNHSGMTSRLRPVVTPQILSRSTPWDNCNPVTVAAAQQADTSCSAANDWAPCAER